MPTWSVVLAGNIMLAVAYLLVYPQSVFYAAIVGVTGLYALVSGLDMTDLIGRSHRNP